jgi:hypothetical protein
VPTENNQAAVPDYFGHCPFHSVPVSAVIVPEAVGGVAADQPTETDDFRFVFFVNFHDIYLLNLHGRRSGGCFIPPWSEPQN